MLLYCTKLWNTDSGFYSCVITKLMNSNTYSITAYSILCNTNSYYSVITITVYQTYPKSFFFSCETYTGSAQLFWRPKRKI